MNISMRIKRRAALLPLVLAAAGCTTGNSIHEPTVTTVNVPATTKLEFAVGTANIYGMSTGLNAVVSFRQATGSGTGLAGTLVNTPTISGPAGFVVPAAAAAGADAGTSTITGQTQTPQGAATPPPDTFLETGGAFEYGFAPANADTSGSAFYPQFSFGGGPDGIFTGLGATSGAFSNTYEEPLYADATFEFPYLGGPPAYPFFQDGTQSPGFLGYPSGFTIFEGATPVAGTYNLNLTIPGNTKATATSVTASGTLASTALLPVMPAPTFTEDGLGGGTISVAVPAGVTETLVYVVDVNPNQPNFYTVELTGSGTLTATLGDTLGPQGANTIAPPSGGIPGDPYFVYAVGFDYPAFEAAPPTNRSATPVIAGANGQADVTLSLPGFSTGYGSTPAGLTPVTPSARTHRAFRRR